MKEEKLAISSAALIKLANEQLLEHDDYIDGVHVESVAERHGVISFKGESFLDEQGLPTAQSMAAFNIYKWLCHHFSAKYTLLD